MQKFSRTHSSTHRSVNSKISLPTSLHDIHCSLLLRTRTLSLSRSLSLSPSPHLANEPDGKERRTVGPRGGRQVITVSHTDPMDELNRLRPHLTNSIERELP
jgi:hypothetical protein